MSRIARSLMLSAALVAVWSVATATQAAGPAVNALDQVSAKSEIVIAVPNLAEASRQLAAWSQAAGIPSPEMMDALGSFKSEMGLEAGLDDNGSMLIVIQNLAEAIENESEPDAIMLMPVQDYATFLGNFGVVGEADGITEMTFANTNETAFVKQVGGFAVLAETRELAAAYTPANNGGNILASLGATGAEALADSNAFIYMDFEKSGPLLLTLIDEAIAEMKAEMMAIGAAAPGMEEGLQMYATAAQTVINSSTAMVIGMDVDAQGLGFSKVLKMKPDSALAKYFPGGASTAAKQLAKLPENPYIFAMAIDGKAVNGGELYAAILEGMGPAVKEQMGAAYDQAIALGTNAKSMSAVFYAPDQMAMMSGSIFNMVSVVETADAAGYVQTLSDYIKNINGMNFPIDPTAPDGPAITYQCDYTANALQLDGVSVDQFQIQTVMPMEMMQQMGPMAGFINMFTNYRGYVATQGNQVLISTSPDPQSVTTALSVIDEETGIGSAGAIVEQRNNSLPENSAMEMYLSLGGIAEMANMFVGMMGVPTIEVPADLPPIAMAMSVEGDAMTGRMYVPASSVQFVINSVMQMQAGMGGPGGPGGPPRGPAPY